MKKKDKIKTETPAEETVQEPVNAEETVETEAAEQGEATIEQWQAALETAVDQDSFNQAIEAVNQAAADRLNALSHLDAEEQKAAVADAITDAMADHSIEGGSAVVDYVAELLVEEFSDKIADGSVSPDEIADYLGLYPKS